VSLRRIAAVPDSEMAYLSEHLVERRYKPRAALQQAGEAAVRCWFLSSGFLRFYFLADNGREYNKAFSRPGDVVVPFAGVATATPSDYCIEAVTEAVTATFPSELITTLYERHPCWDRIGRVLVEQMALRKEARERELLMDPTIVRYRRFAERYPELVGVVPQRQVASYIGVTEQALSRVLREARTES
jgi:CRP-like cAMP-binding protein